MDDTTVLVGGEEGLKNVSRIVEIFSGATGMSVNSEKSKLLEVGSWVGGELGKKYGWQVVEQIKICGVLYRGAAQGAREANSKRVVQRVLLRLGGIRTSGLTIQQSHCS